MAKTVLVYASVPGWEYHHAESVELALTHLSQGDHVHILTCTGTLRSCAANAKHLKGLCNLCTEQQRRTRHILRRKNVTWHTVTFGPNRSMDFPPFSSISALRDFGIDGVPHGAFVASQLVDDTRDGYPDMSRHAATCNGLLAQSVALYEYTLKLLGRIKAERVYVWNGRRPSDGPVIAAARKLNIPFTTHIWDYDEPWEFTKGFITIDGSAFHDLTRIREVVRFRETDPPLSAKQEQEALSYLESVTSASRQLYGSDLRNAPLSFLAPETHKVGIFTTSEWEFAGEPTWENRLYPSQWVGIEKLVTEQELPSNVQLVVRLHPNLVNSPQDSGEWSTIRRVQAAATSRVHFVQPADPVDSYRLLLACDTIVTFGSTIGVEASWRGKPVVLLGTAHYAGAGFCYEPQSHDEAIRLLSDKLPPAPKDRVLRYAYQRLTSVWKRTEFRHLRLDSENRIRYGNYRLFRPAGVTLICSFVGRLARKMLGLSKGNVPLG